MTVPYAGRMPLDNDLKTFATSGNFAALTTLGPNGQPSTQMMWIDADDDHLIFNTETHRAKFANIERDPRVTITVIDNDSAYRYVEARGHVVDKVTGPEARTHVDEVSRRYTGQDYQGEIKSERVKVTVAVERIHKWGL